jgi:hypothetical protein
VDDVSAAVAARAVIFDIASDLYFDLVAVVPGAAGNAISYRLTVAGISTPLSISVAGKAISVAGATDSSGLTTTTLSALIAALEATPAFNALVTIQPPFGFLAGNVFTTGLIFLGGGADASGLGSYAF